jgi:hypothetical protein
MADQAVIIRCHCGAADLKPLTSLSNRIKRSLSPALGALDKREIDLERGEASLVLFGPDADRIWRRIERQVRRAPFMRGATVRLRFDPPAQEKVVYIP